MTEQEHDEYDWSPYEGFSGAVVGAVWRTKADLSLSEEAEELAREVLEEYEGEVRPQTQPESVAGGAVRLAGEALGEPRTIRGIANAAHCEKDAVTRWYRRLAEGTPEDVP